MRTVRVRGSRLRNRSGLVFDTTRCAALTFQFARMPPDDQPAISTGLPLGTASTVDCWRAGSEQLWQVSPRRAGFPLPNVALPEPLVSTASPAGDTGRSGGG